MQSKRTPSSAYFKRMNKREASVLEQSAVQSQSCVWDYSQDGGATGTYSFGAMLPANSVITAVYADEQSNVTSGGAATLKLQAGSTDLTGAVAYTAFAGVTAPALAGSAAAIKLSADSELKMALAAAAATAGKIKFTVFYYSSK